MIKRLEWNKKTASVFAVVAALTIVLVVALNPREITIAENTTLDPVEWTFQRPNESVDILNKLNATYTGDLSVNMYVLILHYKNNSIFVGDYDYLRISMAINATVGNAGGFIESVHVVAQKDQTSEVDWLETQFEFENLSLAARADGYRKNTHAYIKLAGVNHTGSVRAKAIVEWTLLTPNTQSHQLEVAYEIVYYNGTAYNKVVQPFQLNIVGERNVNRKKARVDHLEACHRLALIEGQKENRLKMESLKIE